MDVSPDTGVESFGDSVTNYRQKVSGGTDYLVYDKNDEFGGAHYIERFTGWFNYIRQQNQH